MSFAGTIIWPTIYCRCIYLLIALSGPDFRYEFSCVNSCDRMLLFAAEVIGNSLFFIFLRQLAFLARAVQKCLQLIGGNHSPFPPSAGGFAEKAEGAQVLSWQTEENSQEIQSSHTEHHQPGTCPIIFILGRRGRENISRGLERRAPFCALISCSKWHF